LRPRPPHRIQTLAGWPADTRLAARNPCIWLRFAASASGEFAVL